MYWLNIPYKQLCITLNEIWLYESDPNAPSTCSKPGGKKWQHSIRGWRNWIYNKHCQGCSWKWWDDIHIIIHEGRQHGRKIPEISLPVTHFTIIWHFPETWTEKHFFSSKSCSSNCYKNLDSFYMFKTLMEKINLLLCHAQNNNCAWFMRH